MNEEELKEFFEGINNAKGECLKGAKVNGTDIHIFLDNHVIRIKQNVDCRCIDCLPKDEEKVGLRG